MDSFKLASPFSFFKILEKWSNKPSSIDFSALGADSSKIVRASNNPDLFPTPVKPLVACMRR